MNVKNSNWTRRLLEIFYFESLAWRNDLENWEKSWVTEVIESFRGSCKCNSRNGLQKTSSHQKLNIRELFLNHTEIFYFDDANNSSLHMYSTFRRSDKEIFKRVRDHLLPSARSGAKSSSSSVGRSSVSENVIDWIDEKFNPALSAQISAGISRKTLRCLQDSNYNEGPIQNNIRTQLASKRRYKIS